MAFFAVIPFLPFLDMFAHVKRLDKCNICLYHSCSSSYLLNACGDIQNSNLEGYYHLVDSHSSPQASESDRINLYSAFYGDNMNKCFTSSRLYCVQNTCYDDCKKRDENKIDPVMPTPDTIVNPDNANIPTGTTTYINYIVNSDNCYSQNLKVDKMYTECVLSPFFSNCTARFVKEASRQVC